MFEGKIISGSFPNDQVAISMTGHEHMRCLRIVYLRYTLHELIELMSAQTGLQIRLGSIEVPLLLARG